MKISSFHKKWYLTVIFYIFLQCSLLNYGSKWCILVLDFVSKLKISFHDKRMHFYYFYWNNVLKIHSFFFFFFFFYFGNNDAIWESFFSQNEMQIFFFYFYLFKCFYLYPPWNTRLLIYLFIYLLTYTRVAKLQNVK